MSRNAGSGKDEAFVPSDDTEITTAEELSYRLHQQELLSQFGLFISRRVNLGDIMSEVARTGANGLGVKLCKVLELIQCMDEPRLLVRSGVGWAEGVVGHATVGADLESPAGFALRTGRPVISNHLAQESRFRTPKLLAEHGVTRAINVLIPAGEPPFGVLEADCSGEGLFSERDVAFLQALAAMLASAIDRHGTERRLAANEARFRATFEQAAVGMAHVALDGRWLHVNERLCQITEYSPGELQTTDFQAITHPDDLMRDLAQVQRLLSGEIETYSIEKRYIRKSGLYVWVNLTVALLRDENGLPLHFISVIEDIDRRKQAEAALQALNSRLEERVAERTAALEESNRLLREQMTERERAENTLRHAEKMTAVGELTSGIAHDFNNVLTAISGSIELAMRTEGDAAHQRLRRALAAIERGGKLAKDLLGFARTTPFQPEVFDVGQRVASMRDMLDRSLGDQIRVEAVVSADLPPVRADADQMELAILNAAVNARDAMPNGGMFRIVVRPAGDQIELMLSDTGSGMPADVAERAFEPFFTTKPRGEGSGLGLAQIYGFARQCGGSARIDTAPGEGTTILLKLPAWAGEASVHEE